VEAAAAAAAEEGRDARESVQQAAAVGGGPAQGDALGPFLQQLAALGAELDEALVDWDVLGQAAPWAVAGGAGDEGWGAPQQPAPRALEARRALAALPLDAVQLLCRQLLAPEAPAAAAAGVLRWGVVPQLEALAGAAPQALLECLAAAGGRRGCRAAGLHHLRLQAAALWCDRGPAGPAQTPPSHSVPPSAPVPLPSPQPAPSRGC
jgi:hypothetical protein